MDIETFKEQAIPNRLRRRDLHQAAGQIALLKAEGYSIRQIRDFLEPNGVKVTYEALQKFFVRNIKKSST